MAGSNSLMTHGTDKSRYWMLAPSVAVRSRQVTASHSTNRVPSKTDPESQCAALLSIGKTWEFRVLE